MLHGYPFSISLSLHGRSLMITLSTALVRIFLLVVP